jgi:hypothetical protein
MNPARAMELGGVHRRWWLLGKASAAVTRRQRWPGRWTAGGPPRRWPRSRVAPPGGPTPVSRRWRSAGGLGRRVRSHAEPPRARSPLPPPRQVAPPPSRPDGQQPLAWWPRRAAPVSRWPALAVARWPRWSAGGEGHRWHAAARWPGRSVRSHAEPPRW